MNKNASIHIVGAGVSGLVCALELENAGLAPVVLEKSESVGGRVQTDRLNGLPLDRGFQVLLTEYPAVQRYLDLPELKLRYFLPGATLFRNGTRRTIGDPLRSPSLLLPTLLSGLGTVGDQWRVLQLSRKLKGKTLETIFSEPEKPTLYYLRDYGFSDAMIDQFFRPFFGGIFLEKELSTSSRMFEFVYKMFATGRAALPAAGIGAVPAQLAARLQRTTFRFATGVRRVETGRIRLDNGDLLESDATILASDPTSLLEGYSGPTRWNDCLNLYFEAPASVLKKPIIGLMARPDCLVNNFHFLTDLLPGRAERAVLSATLVNLPDLEEKQLIESVKQEMAEQCGIRRLSWVATYRIEHALPVLSNLSYAPAPDEVVWQEGIYLAGDRLANPSLNAAMESGKEAARAVIRALEASH